MARRPKSKGVAFDPSTLVASGIDCVRAGADLLEEGATERDLRVALREVSSGVELVMKGVLSAEHWSLLFEAPGAADRSTLASGDFKSVSFDACIERLGSIADLPFSEKHGRLLRGMRAQRNRLEHLGIVSNVFALRASLGNSLHVLVDLIRRATDKGLLEENAQQHTLLAAQLSDVDDFVKARWKEIRGSVIDDAASCPSCGQPALSVLLDDINCEFCHAQPGPEEVALHAVRCAGWVPVDDGFGFGPSPPPIRRCPACWSDALVDVTSERGGHGYRCFACDERFASRSITLCVQCGEPCSEQDIVTAIAAGGLGPPTPCRLVGEPEWRRRRKTATP